VQIRRVEVQVGLCAFRLLGGVQGVLEMVTTDTECGLAEHLDQPSIGVEREPLVTGLQCQSAHRLVVQSDVEDGLHHAPHREPCTRADRDQQRVVRLPQFLIHRRLEGTQVVIHLGPQLAGLLTVGQIHRASLGGDGEARGYRQPHPRHLGQLRPLSAKEILQVLVAFSELVHKLRHGGLLAADAFGVDSGTGMRR
jgi:hypothetical protein